jgi:ribose transport system substrate-binding protein
MAVFAGCGGGGQGAPQGKPQVALIMKSLANEFFHTMQEGARSHQNAHFQDYDLIPNGIKDELDVGKQIELVEQMIAQHVTAIVIAPADSKALVAVCKKAQDAGIVVVNIDNKLDEAVLAEKNAKIPFVGPNNREGAHKAGDYLALRLRPNSPVAIIEGVPTAFNAVQRKLGFEDAMKKAGMNIVASQSAGWEMDKANQVMAAILAEHPEVQGVLCANDSMALGALAALKAAGKAGHAQVVGFDNISAVHELVGNGEILATVDQHGDKLAVFGIEYALQMVREKSQPADKETPVDLITADNFH